MKKFPHSFNFPALDIKKLLKNKVTFRLNFAYMVNSFVVSLDITVIMINILQEIIKTLHEKMLGNK